MLKIFQTVLVEGKYDKMRLSNIIDAKIITTGGFDIFNDAPKRELLRRIAKKNGIIVLTDSDRAGFAIRGKISGFLPKENVFHLYIPRCPGKEKRKAEPGKDGILGVEGISDEILLSMFSKFASSSAVRSENGSPDEKEREFSKQDLYAFGLSGADDSSEKRSKLALSLGMPSGMTANALLTALNALYTYGEIAEFLHSL